MTALLGPEPPPALSTAQRFRRPLLLAVLVAQLADLLTFVPAVGVTGIGAEQNPLARQLFALMGPAGPAALKLIAVVALVLLVRRVVIRFPAAAFPAATLAIALGLLGMASNVVVGLL